MMARLTNKASVAVLDEADRAQRILDWQLFCMEQERMLWDYDPDGDDFASYWHPGVTLRDWWKDKAKAERTRDEWLNFLAERGNWGNHPRRTVELGHPVLENREVYDDFEECDDLDEEGLCRHGEEAHGVPISYEYEQRLYQDALVGQMIQGGMMFFDETLSFLERDRLPGLPRHRVMVCMDCLVGWDLEESEACWVCGAVVKPLYPKSMFQLPGAARRVFYGDDDPQTRALREFLRPRQVAIPRPGQSLRAREYSSHAELSRDVVDTDAMYDRHILEFRYHHDIDFDSFDFLVKTGGYSYTIRLSREEVAEVEGLDVLLSEVKARLVREAVKHLEERARDQEPGSMSDLVRERLMEQRPVDVPPELRPQRNERVEALIVQPTVPRGRMGEIYRRMINYLRLDAETEGHPAFSWEPHLDRFRAHWLNMNAGPVEPYEHPAVKMFQKKHNPAHWPIVDLQQRFYGIIWPLQIGDALRTPGRIRLKVADWWYRNRNVTYRRPISGEFPTVGEPFDASSLPTFVPDLWVSREMRRCRR